MERHLSDVITCAKFQDETFRGYNFTWVEFHIFLFIFAWALQQQRDCPACDTVYVEEFFSDSVVSVFAACGHAYI